MHGEEDPGRRPVGRFAPTPSGALHLGSLFAAVASWLSIRARGGRWLLRIDDLDPPRVRAGSAEQIQQQLLAAGLDWDGPVHWQAPRRERHRAARDELLRRGLAFSCACTRSGLKGQPHLGRCRPGSGATAVRIDAAVTAADWIDGLQGPQPGTTDDVLIWRKEDLPAYHLACVVDDADAGVDEVLRGADLLPSTAAQRHLQRLLGLPTPRYLHVPVLLDEAGHKLAKSRCSAPLERAEAASWLAWVLSRLGLPADPRASAREQLDEALRAYDESGLPRRPSLTVTADPMAPGCTPPGRGDPI